MHAPSGTVVRAKLDLMGSRPSGETPADAAVVKVALAASRALNVRAVLDCSSTDSNVPISLGIPAITIGAGGTSANTHSTAEWYDPTGRETGLKRIVVMLAALAGLRAD